MWSQNEKSAARILSYMLLDVNSSWSHPDSSKLVTCFEEHAIRELSKLNFKNKR